VLSYVANIDNPSLNALLESALFFLGTKEGQLGCRVMH
jgi:hypothetical protein